MRRRPAGALATAAATLTVLFVPSAVGADDRRHELEEVTSRISELSDQIDDVTAQRSELAARVRAAGGRLDELLEDISSNEAAIGSVSAELELRRDHLAGLRLELNGWYDRLFETRTEIAVNRVGALDTARGAYMRGRQDLATLAFAADQIVDVSIGVAYLERVAAHNGGTLNALLALETAASDQERAVRSQELLVESEVAKTETLQFELERLSEHLDADRAGLEAGIAELEGLLRELDEELSHFETELDALEGEQRRIKRTIAAAQAKKRTPRQAEPEISAGGFVRPVPGAITSGFGPRYHPILGYSRMHTGVDMKAGKGEAIKSAADGTVILAGTWGGYGRTVVVDHGNGLSTLYAHMSSIKVSKGESVSAAEVVGKVGSSGLATGAHLHFEVRFEGDPVDPEPYLRG